MEILEGLINGKTIEEIVSQSQNKWLKKRREELVRVVGGSLKPGGHVHTGAVCGYGEVPGSDDW
ncbi:MAG: hypothetical protein QXO71_03275 [Candidatus Jordarchaeaceae archaeon]